MTGGLGGGPAYDDGARDTRMVLRAMRERWRIPDHLRDSLPAAMGVILLSNQSSNRDKTTAAKVLIAADSANVKAEAAAEIEALKQAVKELKRELEGGENAGAGGTAEGGQDAGGEGTRPPAPVEPPGPLPQ